MSTKKTMICAEKVFFLFCVSFCSGSRRFLQLIPETWKCFGKWDFFFFTHSHVSFFPQWRHRRPPFRSSQLWRRTARLRRCSWVTGSSRSLPLWKTRWPTYDPQSSVPQFGELSPSRGRSLDFILGATEEKKKLGFLSASQTEGRPEEMVGSLMFRSSAWRKLAFPVEMDFQTKTGAEHSCRDSKRPSSVFGL